MTPGRVLVIPLLIADPEPQRPSCNPLPALGDVAALRGSVAILQPRDELSSCVPRARSPRTPCTAGQAKGRSWPLTGRWQRGKPSSSISSANLVDH